MKTKNQDLARKNMYMSQEVAKWYEDESVRIGVSQSALMSMVLSNYIDQKKALAMGDILERLESRLDENE